MERDAFYTCRKYPQCLEPIPFFASTVYPLGCFYLLPIPVSTVHCIMLLLQSCVATNIGLGIFNLIPLPPLDGSKILKAILPSKARKWYENNQKILLLVFIILVALSLSSLLIDPFIKIINKGLINLINAIASLGK